MYCECYQVDSWVRKGRKDRLGNEKRPTNPYITSGRVRKLSQKPMLREGFKGNVCGVQVFPEKPKGTNSFQKQDRAIGRWLMPPFDTARPWWTVLSGMLKLMEGISLAPMNIKSRSVLNSPLSEPMPRTLTHNTLSLSS